MFLSHLLLLPGSVDTDMGLLWTSGFLLKRCCHQRQEACAVRNKGDSYQVR